MAPSISSPNYAVERCAVANNQINEFGYLDSIIASPLLLQHAQQSFIQKYEHTLMEGDFWPEGESFLFSTEPALTAQGRGLKTSAGNQTVHKSFHCYVRPKSLM